MIKLMASEHMQIDRAADNEVILTINGIEQKLSVDELNELRTLADHFWGANDLYQWTSQAIAERKRWEETHDMPTSNQPLSPLTLRR